MGMSSILERKTGKSVCPLQNVEVRALIGEGLAEVTVIQNYANLSGRNIEALYTFPIPHNAQVNSFKAKINECEVTGEIMEKEAAFKQYNDA